MDPRIKLVGQEQGTVYSDIIIIEDTDALEQSLLMPEKNIPYNYCAYQPHCVGY